MNRIVLLFLLFKSVKIVQNSEDYSDNNNNCNDVSVECKIIAIKCLSPNRVEQKLMELACPMTCGYCNEPFETSTEVLTTSTTTTTTTTQPPFIVRSRCYDESDDCEKRSKFCTRRLYRRMMNIQCARTCRFCIPEDEILKPGEDEDEDLDISREMHIRTLNSKLGRETVEKLKKMRIVDNVLSLVKKPSTTSTPPQCVDRANDCSKTAKLCKSRKYIHIFRKLCASTCNYCEFSTVQYFSDTPISVLDYIDDEEDLDEIESS
ncbi:unnamed protein product [Caenorhabditis angaria]|uniref:ShKT domain-containing protein n=1 Tax=Caenorhabditis angaria TaxID=860376 RepID=A0A9P1IVS1_9PELO|nr:unnamed protein product [Caenorhabditis angaria]